MMSISATMASNTDKHRDGVSTGPATASGIPIRNIWHMLLYAWDQVDRIGSWRAELENAPSLDALLATILGSLIQQRHRIGLGRDYDTHVEEIAGIRGRLLFGASVKRLSLPHGRTVCRYQVFTADVQKNRIVRSTIAALVERGQFGDSSSAVHLRSRLRKLGRQLEAIQLFPLTQHDIGRELLKRHDRDYSIMLAICQLVQQRLLPTESAGLGRAPAIDRDGLVLHKVYERFVARFYAVHLTGWDIQPQPQWSWPTHAPSAFLPSMRPDLVLQNRLTGRVIVIDTKFTPHVLSSGQWGTLKFSRDHLFQIYAYVKSQSQRSREHAAATGILLYPTAHHAIREQVEIQGNIIRWETVDLAKSWEEVEATLIAIPRLING
jgi:5-methylcytosine-specific restriction enzyme subunit McrC